MYLIVMVYLTSFVYILGYIASNYRMIIWKTWKETVLAQFKLLLQYSSGRTEESHEKFQDSWSTGQYLNLVHPVYKPEMLIPQPRISVNGWKHSHEGGRVRVAIDTNMQAYLYQGQEV
jgi:hypothetical protein